MSEHFALITGAGSPDGIGFHTARALAKAGHSVFLSGHSQRVRDRAAELIASGHTADGFAGDLTDQGARNELLDFVTNTTTHLDALVINHGMTSVENPMEDTGESWLMTASTITSTPALSQRFTMSANWSRVPSLDSSW